MLLTEAFSDFYQYALTIATSALRIVIAFLIIPIFSNELIPSLIRNAIFVSMSVLVVALQPAPSIEGLSVIEWMSLAGKELLIGIAIGVFFGVHLWAFEAAGQIIDTQIGLNGAQIYDPISGHQTTLIGEFLARFANYIFVATGGLMLLSGVIMQSYALFPVSTYMPEISTASLRLFTDEFGFFISLMLLISAPILTILFLIDLCMGLINRDAQQFNVFFLSMSIKMLATIFILILSLTFIADKIIEEIIQHSDKAIPFLKQLLRSY